MKSSTETLIKALEILAREIESPDGVANAAIAEAAERLLELSGQTRLKAADRDKLQDELINSMNQRDALKAQVSRLREVANHYQQGLVPSDNSMDEIIHRLSETPQQCLAEVRAQAGRDAVVSALRLYGEPSITFSEIDSLADKYANQIRQQSQEQTK